jgi:hypothetical protein
VYSIHREFSCTSQADAEASFLFPEGRGSSDKHMSMEYARAGHFEHPLTRSSLPECLLEQLVAHLVGSTTVDCVRKRFCMSVHRSGVISRRSTVCAAPSSSEFCAMRTHSAGGSMRGNGCKKERERMALTLHGSKTTVAPLLPSDSLAPWRLVDLSRSDPEGRRGVGERNCHLPQSPPCLETAMLLLI